MDWVAPLIAVAVIIILITILVYIYKSSNQSIEIEKYEKEKTEKYIKELNKIENMSEEELKQYKLKQECKNLAKEKYE